MESSIKITHQLTVLRPNQVRSLIRSGHICFAGHRKLKVYGNLHCRSGKRMKQVNRVFFASEAEAVALGFRPCGHCMREQYRVWRQSVC